ncbi:MAG: alpha/beta hydrolase [Bacteroidetes bacterium]|nr:alpha/beta hydrolase [Bacteroidota bacterium]
MEDAGFRELDGKSIFFQWYNSHLLAGQKPFLIFLHEGLGSIGQWRDFPALLADQVQCPALLYDRYGYGRSTEITSPRTISFLHDEALLFLPDLLKSLEVASLPHIIVGHSDGGTIALIYAGAFPLNTKGVITEAAHVFSEQETLGGIHRVVEEYQQRGLRNVLEKYHGNKTESMFRSWTRVWLSPEAAGWNIESFLPGISCPLLVIQGMEDQFGTPAQVDAIVRQVSSPAKPLMIPGCGHIPHKQAQELVLREMNDFILSIK